MYDFKMNLPTGIGMGVIAFVFIVVLPCIIQRKRLWQYFKRECLFSCQGAEEEGGDEVVGHANEARQDGRRARPMHQTNASAGHELQELDRRGRVRVADRQENRGTEAAGSSSSVLEGSSSLDE
jgi:hypothetical protein